MRRESASLLVLLIILTVSLLSAIEVQSVEASGTIYISADGGIDPRDAPISTIDNVTYTLTGNITGDYGSALFVERDNIVVDGSAHTIDGVSEYGIGIWLNGRNNVTIRNVNITNFRTGIHLESCSLISINTNTIENCFESGIWLYSCSLISIYGNILARNIWEGIWVDSSSNISINGNVIKYSYYSLWLNSSHNNVIKNHIEDADILLCSSDNHISGNAFSDCGLIRVRARYSNSVENNTVNGKPLVYLEGVSDYQVEDAGQVILIRCDSIRVENLNLSRTSTGVQLMETNSCIVSGNNVTANTLYGIYLEYSANNSIGGNDITNDGITSYEGGGICLSLSSNNSLTGNNIADNSYAGIELSSSTNNSISENTIANNGHGIILSQYYDEYTFGPYTFGPLPSFNSIWHNNFINNTIQATPYDTSINTWDSGYPSGGNYWSDYLTRYPNATEIDHTRIGDTVYVIDANNTDHYPLMTQYVIPEFPTFLIPALFMVTTLLAVIVYRRKHR
jgi:parallel beta-helix repeat protein